MVKKHTRICERKLFTWLILAGLIFLFTPSSLTNKLQFGFARVFNRPLNICRDFQLAISKQPSMVDVIDRNRYIELRNHLANNMQWLYQENQKVEKLSGLRDRSIWNGANFVLADVITAFIENSRSELIINRGRDDGLTEGQFVLGQHSIVGTVSELDSRTARVCLVTDFNSRMAVVIGKSNLQGIMQGKGNCLAKIILLSIKHKIKVGDIVYVRKKPGFLDVPLIAGTVEKCKADNENPLLWDITIRPACDIQRLNSVVVLVMNSQQQNQTGQPAGS